MRWSFPPSKYVSQSVDKCLTMPLFLASFSISMYQARKRSDRGVFWIDGWQ